MLFRSQVFELPLPRVAAPTVLESARLLKQQLIEARAQLDREVAQLTRLHRVTNELLRPDDSRALVERFAEAIVSAGVRRVLRLELDVARWRGEGPLSGNGLIVINPPFPLEGEARTLLPWLASTLAAAPADRTAGARGAHAGAALNWLIDSLLEAGMNRHFCRTLVALFAAIAATPAITLAQPGFPTKPIRLIVPFPAGGGPDVVMQIGRAHV